jgi:hypothetical protein
MYKKYLLTSLLITLSCLFVNNLKAQNTATDNKLGSRKQIMEKIDSVLNEGKKTQAPQTYFAALYTTMVGEIQKANTQGHFTDSLLIDYIQKNFTDYYLNALNSYSNNDSLPGAWQAALDTSICKNCSYVQWLALGTNAHINHDLYFILLTYFKQNGTANHQAKKTQQEFFEISARETDRIVGVFIKTDPNINTIEGFFIKNGSKAVKKQMKKYLKTTWKNAMEAANNPTKEAAITQNQLNFAQKNANAFLKGRFPIKIGFNMMKSLDKLNYETKISMLAAATKK